MATKAYILIETVIGESRQVAEALRAVPRVETASVVTGPYDVIAVVEAPDLSQMGDLLAGSIHSIAGIRRTITCLSVQTA